MQNVRDRRTGGSAKETGRGCDGPKSRFHGLTDVTRGGDGAMTGQAARPGGRRRAMKGSKQGRRPLLRRAQQPPGTVWAIPPGDYNSFAEMRISAEIFMNAQTNAHAFVYSRAAAAVVVAAVAVAAATYAYARNRTRARPHPTPIHLNSTPAWPQRRARNRSFRKPRAPRLASHAAALAAAVIAAVHLLLFVSRSRHLRFVLGIPPHHNQPPPPAVRSKSFHNSMESVTKLNRRVFLGSRGKDLLVHCIHGDGRHPVAWSGQGSGTKGRPQ